MSEPNNPYNEALAGTLIDRSIRERIVLVAVALPGDDDEAVDASLDELALLVDTAGADEVAVSYNGVTLPTTRGISARERPKSSRSCVSPSTPTPWSSTTNSRRLSSSTWRSCSAAQRSTGPP